MKKLIFCALLLVAGYSSSACDICGCGGSNLYMGLLPSFNSKFIGIRYHYSQFHTQLASDPTQFSHNYYNSVELWSGWNIGRRWQVLAFVPYYFNKQSDDDGTTYKNGLGDISVLGNFQLLHSRNSTANNSTIEQELWIGAGIKAPTGTFKVDVKDSTTTIADINAQIGTGSTDFLLNAVHHIRINQFGVNTVVNYKINTANSSDYKYGNKFTGTSIAYYRFRFSGMGLAPNAGIIYEHTETNSMSGEKVNLTGGYALSGMAGLEWNFRNVSLGCNIQTPFTQNYADGQTKMQVRAMFHATFTI